MYVSAYRIGQGSYRRYGRKKQTAVIPALFFVMAAVLASISLFLLPALTREIPAQPAAPIGEQPDAPTATAAPATEEPTEPVTEPVTEPPPPGRPPELQLLVAPRTPPAGDDYFTDSVFIGDSISVGFKMYITRERDKNKDFMSNAYIFAAGSYSLMWAVTPLNDENLHPTYNNGKMLPKDFLKLYGARKVFIMLGMNDIAGGIDVYFSRYDKVLKDIRSENPGITIILLPITPVLKGAEKGSFYNANIDSFNNAMIQFAQDNGCCFVDISTPLKDDEGYLKEEFCGDGFVHQTFAAYAVWEKTLREHAVPEKLGTASGAPE